MSAAEDLCAHWIVHYEAYRVWQQFERDSRVDYSVRRWNMLSAEQMYEGCAGLGPTSTEFGCVLHLMASLTEAVETDDTASRREKLQRCRCVYRHVARAVGVDVPRTNDDWQPLAAIDEAKQLLSTVFESCEVPFLLAAANRTVVIERSQQQRADEAAVDDEARRDRRNIPAVRPNCQPSTSWEDARSSTSSAAATAPSSAAATGPSKRLLTSTWDKKTSPFGAPSSLLDTTQYAAPAPSASTSTTVSSVAAAPSTTSAPSELSATTDSSATSAPSTALPPSTAALSTPPTIACKRPADDATAADGETPSKLRRRRVPWTAEEELKLVAGVAKYGKAWTVVLQHNFAKSGRTNTDLKDKWVVLSKKSNAGHLRQLWDKLRVKQ